MTYKELLNYLRGLTEEQLNMFVTVVNNATGFPTIALGCDETKEDVTLPINTPYIIIDC